LNESLPFGPSPGQPESVTPVPPERLGVDIAERLASVRRRIADAAHDWGRDPDAITLLAVSKTHPAEAVRAAWQAGQRRFGESYVQEALGKIAALADTTAEWHFIGPLQSNKTKAVAENFDWVHSVARPRVAQRLSGQRPAGRPPLQVCLQVNVSGEASKAGVEPGEVSALAEAVQGLPGLALRGLMAIPAPSDDFDEQRRSFARLREAFERLNACGYGLDTLSMGMSGDLEAAIAEGATLVRVGTAIFGPRPPARQ